MLVTFAETINQQYNLFTQVNKDCKIQRDKCRRHGIGKLGTQARDTAGAI